MCTNAMSVSEHHFNVFHFGDIVLIVVSDILASDFVFKTGSEKLGEIETK